MHLLDTLRALATHPLPAVCALTLCSPNALRVCAVYLPYVHFAFIVHCVWSHYPLTGLSCSPQLTWCIHCGCSLCSLYALTVLVVRTRRVCVQSLGTHRAPSLHTIVESLCTLCTLAVHSAYTRTVPSFVLCLNSGYILFALIVSFVRKHYTLFAHSFCTVCTRCARTRQTLCALVVYSPCKLCAFSVHALRTLCAPNAHSVYTVCAVTLHSLLSCVH